MALGSMILGRVIGGLGPFELLVLLVPAGLWAIVVWTIRFGRRR
jgi:hypothetical protein